MSEETTSGDSGIGEDTAQGGGTHPLHGQGGEGREKERATPPLEDESEEGQTQVDAPDDETGGQRGGEDRTD